MNSNPCRAEILEALCELGGRYQFDGKLGFLVAEEAAYRSPADSAQTLAALAEKFAAAALIEAGVAVPSSEGLLRLSPALARPGTPFIMLRSDTDGRPYDLLTSEGCLGGASLPLFAALEDRHTASRLRKSDTGSVYVCATIEDAILLRSLSFPATTAAGLIRLTLADIRRLSHWFGLSFSDADDGDGKNQEPAVGVAPGAAAPAPGSNRMAGEETKVGGLSPAPTGEDEEDEYTLEELGIVFVAWTPSRLQLGIPSCIPEIEAYLKAINEHVNASLRLTTWLPTGADIAQMEFAVAHQAEKWLREKIVSSLQNSYYKPLKEPLPQLPTPPVDYADAVGRLLGPVATDSTVIPAPNKPHELWRVAQQLLERDVIRPIADQALRAPDCIECTLTLGLAELSRLFHTQGLLLGKKLSQAVAAQGGDGLKQVPKEAIDQVIALAGRMQSLASEIYRWREATIAGANECRVISLPNSPRLLGSR
jgi:hypothetical protein